MIITELRQETTPLTSRVLATVHWEEGDRPPQEIFYEVDRSRAEGFAPDANAILVGCYLPAIRGGERRIRLAGPVCPRLRAGLGVAAALLQRWYRGSRSPIPIEPEAGFRAPQPRSPERAAFFLTGGIDSMAMLHANRLAFPAGHPGAFREAIAVFGLTVPGQEESPAALDLRDRTVSALEDALEGTGIGLVPVTTNLSTLAPDIAFLELEFLSAALVSAAQLFPTRWSSVSIASGRDVANLFPQGTHPILDESYSSASMTVRHEGLELFRLDKLRTIASWDRAIENLIVCMNPVLPPWLNCGVCEKCIRTMTELIAVGRLEDARRFPCREVTSGMIDSLPRDAGFKRAWEEMLPELRRRGRGDLAEAIEGKLEQTRQVTRWFAGNGVNGRLRALDRRFFGGALLDASRTIRRAAATLRRPAAAAMDATRASELEVGRVVGTLPEPLPDVRS